MLKQEKVGYHLKLKEEGVVVFYVESGNRSVFDKQKLPYGEPLGFHAISTCNGVISREHVIDDFDAIVCSECNAHSTLFQKEKVTYGEILRILEPFRGGRFGIIGQKTGSFERFR